MSTTTAITPETASALRNFATTQLRTAHGRMLLTFKATPDDKLDFKPSETANSVREIVVHTIGGNGFLAGPYNCEICSPEGPTDRETLEQKLTDSTETIIQAIEQLSDEAVGGTIEAFGQTMPMMVFMSLAEWHTARHSGQIDYIQTMYGDMETRM